MISTVAIRCLHQINKPPSNRLLSYSSHGESAAYRHARLYVRPTSVIWSECLQNSVSFIGRVESPLKQIASRRVDNFGALTVLRVSTSPLSHSSFRILLKMWDEMAKRAMQHLKPNDYIYVSGQLGSYTKTAMQGIEKMTYEVIVRELNYVNQSGLEESFPDLVNKSELEHGKLRNGLYLWQVFFANPNEWHDQRRTKATPKQPDFRHKSTGEALWLNENDPPWLKKQIELLDSMFSGEESDHLACKSISRCASVEQLLLSNSYQGQNN